MGNHKIYDRNFKENAVKLGFEKGLTKGARELGIAPSLMTRWRQEFLEFGPASFCGRGSTRLNPEQKRFSELKRKLKHELKESQLKIEIFKNGSKYVAQGRLMIYNFIDNNLDKYCLANMCEVLGADKSTYIKWKNQVISPTQRRTQVIKDEIKSIFFEYRELYGGAKITAELRSRGFKIKKAQVCIYMRKLGLVSKIRRNYKLKSTSRYNPYAFPNILNGQFIVEEPSKAWVSGITRIQTAKGFLFLTIITDLFDRKIIGWSLSDGLTIAETTVPAWDMAVKNRKTKEGLIFHSDRGIQYANKMFTNKLDSYKFIRRSMTRKGNHSDNAVIESFFNSLKSELMNSDMLLAKIQMREKVTEYLKNLK